MSTKSVTDDHSLALTVSHSLTVSHKVWKNLFCSLLVFAWMLLIMVEMIKELEDRPGLMKTSNREDGLDVL